MKLKLDENLGSACAKLLKKAGYDVATIVEQKLSSAPDHRLIQVCKKERRCLVTLDLDFSNPLVFNPRDFSGIAVLRLPSKPSHQDLLDEVKTLAAGLKQLPIDGKLWIISRGRIREYQPEDS